MVETTNNKYSRQSSQDHEETCKQQRRLSRLYGSKSRNLKRGKMGKKYSKKDNVDPQKNGDGNKKVQKFFDRKRDELTVEIHADNYKVVHPWFVGYRNTISLQGRPEALASRYGCDGAVRITKAAKRHGDLETLIDINGYKIDDEIGKKMSIETPKDIITNEKTKKLDRIVKRDSILWTDIIEKAKLQKLKTKSSQKVLHETKLTKHCAKSLRLKNASVDSHLTFLLH